jgi:NADH:ubiquinone oxidoreductase subunit 6 (subunit J)
MIQFFVDTFKWLKSIIFIVLALPFLLIGAIAVASALLGVLVGLIGLMLLMLAGIVKIDSKSLIQGWQDAAKAAK